MIESDRQLRLQADLNPESVFLVERDQRLTYGEVETRVAGKAAELGDRAGEQVVVRPVIAGDSIVEMLAVTRVGATAVVLSPGLPDDLAAPLIQVAKADSRACQSILFTSGSSAMPKGVRLLASNWQAAANASILGLGHGMADRWLCPLPLHHVGGLTILYRSLMVGGSVVLAPDLDDLTAWMGAVQFASLVPTQLHRVLQSRTDVWTNLPVVLVGGGPSPAKLLDQAAMAGLVALPSYGMTETTAQAATAINGDPTRRLFPVAGVEINIGDSSRVMVRGATVSPGYLGEEDRAVGAWFETSDVGRIEKDGALTITGRATRTIISGGENVDPSVVEVAIASHPGIIESAVIGVNDDEWGEVVAVAYVGSPTSDELKLFLTNLVPTFSIPRRWLRVENLPRTELNKVDGAAIRALFG